MQHNNKLKIRNSTADFLVFTKDAHADGIEVRVQDGDVWLTQKAIGQLFEVDRSVVTKHLKAVYASGELVEEATCANFAQVADNGKTYRYKFYSLAAIIAVGYRANSARATQFRQWATRVLATITRQGYVLDKDRLITLTRTISITCSRRSRRSAPSSAGFTRRSPTSTPRRSITRWTARRPKTFSPRCRTRCTTPCTAAPPPR